MFYIEIYILFLFWPYAFMGSFEQSYLCDILEYQNENIIQQMLNNNIIIDFNL